jgi:hypothetical protein
MRPIASIIDETLENTHDKTIGIIYLKSIQTKKVKIKQPITGIEIPSVLKIPSLSIEVDADLVKNGSIYRINYMQSIFKELFPNSNAIHLTFLDKLVPQDQDGQNIITITSKENYVFTTIATQSTKRISSF